MNVFSSKRLSDSCSDNLKSKSGPADEKRPRRLKWAGLSVIAFVLVVAGAAAEAQQATKVTPIGYLTTPSLSANAARHEAFRQGLRELSYVEGKTIVIDWRSADGKLDRLPALAAEIACFC